MSLLLAGLVVFFSVHALPLAGSIRDTVTGAIGRLAYSALFSLLSLAGLILIIYGYGELRADGSANTVFWISPTWMKHIVFLLMLPAFIFMAAAYVPNRIRDTLKHPMLVAIKIWAFSHLLANGDLASVMLFGSFLVYAVVDRISVKRRAAAGMAVGGPVGNRTGGPVGDLIAIAIGLAAYMFMLTVGHGWLFGIALIT